MFKEMFLALIVVFTLSLGLRLIYKKSQKIVKWIICVCLILSCFSAIIYNAKYIFPETYIDTVNGHTKYADMDRNLFSYNDDFIFPDQILFPIMRDRTIYFQEENNPYVVFLKTYSKTAEAMNDIDLSIILDNKEDFTFNGKLSCIGIMDYVKIDSEVLNQQMEEKKYPTFYINLSSLKSSEELVVISDPQYNMYIMSLEYYNSLNGVQK